MEIVVGSHILSTIIFSYTISARTCHCEGWDQVQSSARAQYDTDNLHDGGGLERIEIL